MSKKKSSLGSCLLRQYKKKSHFTTKDGSRHTSDLQDGRDWGRLNLRSVTEQSSLNDFLDKAELAAVEYEEEFSNIKIVEPDLANGILTEAEKVLVSYAQEKNRIFLCIPRRPFWDQDTQKEELDAKEKQAFLEWRKNLSKLQDEEHINMTPYEKNLEVWRQLWRVIERSDVLVQIIDARNPLLFRCPDLETYVKEVDNSKLNVLLFNKADYLTESEREHWCKFFENSGVKIIFFSALEQMQRSPEEDDMLDDTDQNVNSISGDEPDSKDVGSQNAVKNSSKVLSREELIVFLKDIGLKVTSKENRGSVIGLVGYPNVGKSSTINAILMSKKVSVSATPGKTKHFQTLIIDKDLCLCDCPGLVFPNFVSSKAEMVINGILPIDQLTNWVLPITQITNLIPREVLQATYSILIPPPVEGKDPKSPPTADEFLNAYGYNKGFMTQRGLPDNAKSAKYVLKDFINGKLLYCYAPPGVSQDDYHKYVLLKNKKKVSKTTDIETEEKELNNNPHITDADRRFFNMVKGGMHTKGVKTPYGKNRMTSKDPESSNSSATGLLDKPWKKHHNRNKKEKLRRIYKNPYE